MAEALAALMNTWPAARVGVSLDAPAAEADGAAVREAWRTLAELGIATVHLLDAPPEPAGLAAGLRRVFGGALIVSASWTAETAGAAVTRGAVDAVAPHAFVTQADLTRRWRP